MNKKNICVLYGGKSGEHEVSIRSASSVVMQLDREKYRIILIGIDKNGKWYLQTGAKPVLEDTGMLPLECSETERVSVMPGDGFYCGGSRIEIDFVFPVLHGTFGEDGTVQGLIEIADLPYAGSGVSGSAVGMDKEIIKKIWLAEGLRTVPFMSLNADELDDENFSLESFIAETEERFGYPVFVKPVRAGSSVGISRVENAEEFRAAVKEALRFDFRLMIEPGIDAREIECSVIGNLSAEAFIPGEVAPTHAFYDYEAKYIDETGAALLIPAEIEDETIALVKDTAVRAYLSAGIEGMARVDFFINRKNGELLLNEINTIPGFTSISMFSKMCEAGGLPYPEMLDRLITLGERRFRSRNALDFSI